MELEQLAQQAIAIVKQAGELIRSIPRPHVYTKEATPISSPRRTWPPSVFD